MLEQDEIDEINRLRKLDVEEGRADIYAPYIPFQTIKYEDFCYV
ncbi:hypothetical protein [Aeromonas phage 50AhydR13PP]|uniref:Uncharacterized protein n=2 Tax=Tulanevirus TaxID=2560244 RepID=A0A2S1PE63_9CAUD|nr:hypothetical protein [Stenotrophomonas phage IME13]YP_010095574.1 hypothetical protein KNT90_gp091 [Aeromonas phage 50AhydR13PP]AFQ22554.1 hypothetical protein [Stenotrophomonas phage IME13]AWH14838.1 hypothetical protein [Aeromonas phage 50AhydR13PP]